MAKNTWFDETFLPSLFQRATVGKALWVTAKQARVILDHAEHKTSTRRVNYHEYKWEGRTVTLFIAPNRAGQLFFGPTAEENATFEADQEAKEDQRTVNHYKLMVEHRPNQFLEELKKLGEDAQSWKSIIDAQDFEDAEDEAECHRCYNIACKKLSLAMAAQQRALSGI